MLMQGNKPVKSGERVIDQLGRSWQYERDIPAAKKTPAIVTVRRIDMTGEPVRGETNFAIPMFPAYWVKS